MRRIIYTSQVTAGAANSTSFDLLVEQAIRNNARDDLTGLLLFDGTRFLQAFEGPDQSVGACMDRIAADDRHTRIAIVADTQIDRRQFGTFAMAAMMANATTKDTFVAAVKAAVDDVQDDHIKANFIGFAALS